MPNAQLAQRILDEITAKPDHFDMTRWVTAGADIPPGQPLSCGTTMCIAGWAAYLEGYRLVDPAPDEQVLAISPDGEAAEVNDVAEQLLGLTDQTLFFQEAPVAIEMLRQIVDGREVSSGQAARATDCDAFTPDTWDDEAD